jgi:hypothetical protein
MSHVGLHSSAQQWSRARPQQLLQDIHKSRQQHECSSLPTLGGLIRTVFEILLLLMSLAG